MSGAFLNHGSGQKRVGTGAGFSGSLMFITHKNMVEWKSLQTYFHMIMYLHLFATGSKFCLLFQDLNLFALFFVADFFPLTC